MKIKKNHLLLVSTKAVLAGFFLASQPSLDAADVLFVDDETPDASWSTLITGGGNTFTLFDTSAANFALNNQASIDYVEGFDVIVMSGSNPTFNAVRNHGAAWNTLSTPMINVGNFLASGAFGAGSWQWTTPDTGGASNASGVVDVLAPSDPVWSGVTLTGSGPATADIFDGNNAGHLILGPTSQLLPGITSVAAQSGDNSTVAIASAAPGSLRPGSQQQYFFAGMTGGSGNPVNFSADGETAFLNAINTLEAIPEPSSFLLLGFSALFLARRRRA
jgi:hypothetical protein